MSSTTSSTSTFFSRFTLKNFSRRKPVEKSLSEETNQRTLTWIDLTMYGIAATVGSGIYSVVGEVARGRTIIKIPGDSNTYYSDSLGSGVIYSTMIAGLLSALTSICYLEFASALPISGSGYAYFYSMIGEFLGWFIGWNLTLEYAFAAAAIAGKWSNSLKSIIGPSASYEWIFNIPFQYNFRLNFVAPLLVLLLGLIVNRGASMGSKFTNGATILNLSLIAFIVAVGWFYVDYENWSPFIADISESTKVPEDQTMDSFSRIVSGASYMFFCFIGYDTVSTLSTDAINPSRDIPIAAILTIVVATFLYSIIGLILTGMVPWTKLDREKPALAAAFEAVGATASSKIVNIVSLMNMAVTIFACLLGQPKIFAAISRDGLLPSGLARENSRGVPVKSVMLTTLLTAGITAIYDVDTGIIDVISAGCLFSMSAVCAGMLAARFNNAPADLRRYGHISTVAYFFTSIFCCWAIYYKYNEPIYMFGSIALASVPLLALVYMFIAHGNQLKPLSASSTVKSFVCPLMPIIPCLAMAVNNYVFVSIKMDQIALFLAWSVIGISIYLFYGLHNSKLGHEIEAVKSFGKY